MKFLTGYESKVSVAVATRQVEYIKKEQAVVQNIDHADGGPELGFPVCVIISDRWTVCPIMLNQEVDSLIVVRYH